MAWSGRFGQWIVRVGLTAGAVSMAFGDVLALTGAVRVGTALMSLGAATGTASVIGGLLIERREQRRQRRAWRKLRRL
jgi:hypothetical protein